jgi:hypothetical protein
MSLELTQRLEGRRNMAEGEELPDFSLLGGPLHRLGCRLGLVRGGTNTVALGLALGVFLWIVLVALTLIDGIGDRVFSLSQIGAHARLLMAIPLFFLCEAWLDPRMTAFVRAIVSSEIVPKTALPVLEYEIARTVRWKNSWLPEAMAMLAAVLLSLIGPHMHLFGATATPDPTRAVSEMFLTGQWYWIVCLTMFRFLIFRWLWRLGLWCYFLWQVARLELHLVPTHPDGVAGMGSLEVAHSYFAPLVLAISIVMSASFAEEISARTMTLEAIYPTLALILVVDAVLFLGPLYILTPRLWACRVKGLDDYMKLAARYVNDFEKKWLGATDDRRGDLLGSADLQSLADLNNSVSVVRTMRLVPVSQSLLMYLAVAALLPMLPLLLLKYPVAELAQKFFLRLSGM